MRNLRRHTIAASTALALVLSGCSLIPGNSDDDADAEREDDREDEDDDRDEDEDDRDEDDDEPVDTVADTVAEPATTESADAPVTTNPWDGFVEPEPCGIRVVAGEYTPVDCSVPHDAEFAGYVALASEPLADEIAEEIRIIEACRSTVEAYIGQSTADVSVDVEADLFVDDGVAACWTGVLAEETLVGQIGEIGLDAALGEFQMLSTIPIGECFSYADDDSFDVVLAGSCDDLSNDQHAAVITLDERAYPGEDALVEEAFDKCDDALASVEMVHDEYAIVFPTESGFTASGQRTVSCVGSAFGEIIEQGAIWDIPESYEFGVDAPVCMVRLPDDDGSDNSSDLSQVDCNEPHSTELMAVVDAPFEALPNDVGEATQLMHDLCNPFMEQFTGQDRASQGLRVAFQVPAGLGELLDGPVACSTTVGDDDFLVGSLADMDLATALGDVEILAELAPGTCFIFPGESFSLGIVVECSEPGAIMAVGTYTLDDAAVLPTTEEFRAERTIKCTEIYNASGLSGDIDTLSGTFPSDESYLYDGERLGTCDITPV